MASLPTGMLQCCPPRTRQSSSVATDAQKERTHEASLGRRALHHRRHPFVRLVVQSTRQRLGRRVESVLRGRDGEGRVAGSGASAHVAAEVLRDKGIRTGLRKMSSDATHLELGC